MIIPTVFLSLLLVLLHCSSFCDSFTTLSRSRQFTKVNYGLCLLKPSTTCLLRKPTSPSGFFMAEDNESSEAEAPAKGEKELDEVDRSSIFKSILLAVPLFCKFIIVLVIKFLTDLVVFPLLILYRLGRRTKRRIMKLFEKKSDETSTSSGDAPAP
ncbi:expressed unknown protein [Seminavis robusta]|uniref:Uncharacterized protein n=1 Tax=Seminavis robusta TaxID=568900 RepID=A0A9N8H570_9STRA|nr:expressed unknown protein [Seminavis robusta]|eukprot:Sro79_g042670.1 n/a (156) ;mRNA; f:30536-31003